MVRASLILSIFLAPAVADACPRHLTIQREALGQTCVGLEGPSPAPCVVYASGQVAASRTLFYQHQGTGTSAGNYPACVAHADWCGMSIFRLTGDGRLRLIGHAESDQMMPWYFRPYVVQTSSGQLVVSESQSSGTGHYTDDFVFRFGSRCLRRVDVQSWKGVAAGRTTRLSTQGDWWISYRTLVGENARTNGRPDEWSRQPQGGHVWADLALEGDALVVRSVRMTDVPDRY